MAAHWHTHGVGWPRLGGAGQADFSVAVPRLGLPDTPARFAAALIPLLGPVRLHDILYTFNPFPFVPSVSWLQRNVCMNETHWICPMTPLRSTINCSSSPSECVHIVHASQTTELLQQNLLGPSDQSLKKSASSPGTQVKQKMANSCLLPTVSTFPVLSKSPAARSDNLQFTLFESSRIINQGHIPTWLEFCINSSSASIYFKYTCTHT